MSKRILFLLLGVALSAIAMGSYSYTVSGKVYYSSTGTIVSEPTVTLEIEWVSGGWSSTTQTGGRDGSFSFSVTSDTDPKGK